MFDITGWLGRTLQLDFRFTKDDWRQIANNIDRMAHAEMALGLAIIGVAKILDPVWPDPPDNRWYPPPPYFNLPGIGHAVGGGLFLGGSAAKGIAWFIREFL